MSSQLLPGQSLIAGAPNGGDSLISDNGLYTFIMQTDNNIVLYGPGQQVVWTPDTLKAGITTLTMTDGKLLGYDSAGHKIWSLGVDGPNNSFLQVTDDGTAAILCEVWSTATAAKARGATT